jgi:hypothetical protein
MNAAIQKIYAPDGDKNNAVGKQIESKRRNTRE